MLLFSVLELSLILSLTQVVYGSLVTDSTDLQTVSALTEHWLHPGVHKREYGDPLSLF